MSWLSTKVVCDLIGKRHDNLIRTIRTDIEKKLDDPSEYYKEGKYTDGKGQERICYYISVKGCERLSRKIKDRKEREMFLSQCREQAGREDVEVERQKSYFTAKEAAEKAGVSERQVRRWISGGKLSAQKQSFTQVIVSERYVISEEELDRFLKDRRAG